MNGVYLRLAAALAALAVGAAAVAFVGVLLHRTPGPTATAALRLAGGARTASTPTSTPTVAAPNRFATPALPGFPAPPSGAVVLAREDGANAVALATIPKDGRLALQASVVGSDGDGVSKLSLRFVVEGSGGRRAATSAAACGPGCYSASLAWSGRPRLVAVEIGASAHAVRFALPSTWPPRTADRLVVRAARVWRQLRTLVSHERLASDPTHAVQTTYRMVAPHSFSYAIEHGASAIVIGRRRWDRVPGGGWQFSQQDPQLRQPVPYWQSAVDAHVLGSVHVRGRSAWRISFFDPQTPAWFELVVDKHTLRTLDLHMVTTAHFMHDVYGPFNQPFRLRPPHA